MFRVSDAWIAVNFLEILNLSFGRPTHQVVCAIVLRDLEGLVDRYLRKMRKSLARMYWDEDFEEEEDAGT